MSFKVGAVFEIYLQNQSPLFMYDSIYSHDPKGNGVKKSNVNIDCLGVRIVGFVKIHHVVAAA